MKFTLSIFLIMSLHLSAKAHHLGLLTEVKSGQHETKEFKIKHSGGNLYINGLADATIESYDGTEIIISGEVEIKNHEEDQRAKGLKVIDSRGIEDNTGLGYSVVQKDGNVIMTTLGSPHCDCIPITLKVPRGIALVVEDNTFRGENITIKNFNDPIDISVNNHSVLLKNVSGPMAVKTLHGNIESIFQSISQQGVINLISIHGFVDVSLPAETQVDLSLKTQHGEIYTDMDIDITNSPENDTSFGNKVIIGKLNGGGVSMTLNSNFHAVYLRKS